LLQLRDLLRVLFDAGDVLTEIGETGSGYQADEPVPIIAVRIVLLIQLVDHGGSEAVSLREDVATTGASQPASPDIRAPGCPATRVAD